MEVMVTPEACNTTTGSSSTGYFGKFGMSSATNSTAPSSTSTEIIPLRRRSKSLVFDIKVDSCTLAGLKSWLLAFILCFMHDLFHDLYWFGHVWIFMFLLSMTFLALLDALALRQFCKIRLTSVP
ncbi:hypothetical protein WN944_005917 [Citrus x changshan-huyou]|uniref:Transmembrane protein n=1 Tax=Citrus x changshan-huyou TaxID=2935761 RepID=A0AAP0QSP4_9ROSI